MRGRSQKTSKPSPFIKLGKNEEAAETAPALGLAEIYGRVSGRRIFQLRKPTRSSISDLAALPYAIAPSATGRVVTRGNPHIYLTLLPGESIAVGDFARAQKDSWHARRALMGPMRIAAVIGDASNAGAVDILSEIVVSMIETRSDNLFVVNGDESVAEPASRIVFGRGFSIDNATPGKPAITNVEE